MNLHLNKQFSVRSSNTRNQTGLGTSINVVSSLISVRGANGEAEDKHQHESALSFGLLSHPFTNKKNHPRINHSTVERKSHGFAMLFLVPHVFESASSDSYGWKSEKFSFLCLASLTHGFVNGTDVDLRLFLFFSLCVVSCVCVTATAVHRRNKLIDSRWRRSKNTLKIQPTSNHPLKSNEDWVRLSGKAHLDAITLVKNKGRNMFLVSRRRFGLI